MEPLRPEDPRTAGEFRLRARLGAGGMGRVYFGMSPAGRAVAVKVVHPELARDNEFIARFRSEVAAAQAVNGSYTAQVVGTGLYDQPPWLATAYVPGPTLQQLIDERGPLPEQALWRLAAGLSEALQAVHAAGLVHRDLKPNNILVAEDGPRVIDFGVSRALDGTSVTRTGLTIGTPPFMSPEQARGQAVGAPSDVFSLGSVLCFAATGHPPFGDGNAPAVLYRIVHEAPDLDGIPGALRGLIAACLAKQPGDRPPPVQLIASLAAHGEDWTGEFWPAGVTAAIRGYHGMDLNGLRPPAASTAVPARPMTPTPTAVAPEPVPGTSRRRLLTIAGGFGGLAVAGVAVGWTVDRPKTGRSANAAQKAAQKAAKPKAGKVLWTKSQASVPLLLTATTGAVATCPGIGKVEAYQATTGDPLWTWPAFQVEVEGLLPAGSAIIVMGGTSQDGVTALQATTGQQMWTKTSNADSVTIAAGGGLCMIGGSAPSVDAYDLTTGKHAWRFSFPDEDETYPLSLVAVNDAFYVAASDDRTWKVSSGGTELSQFTLPGPNSFPLEVTNGVLCSACNPGEAEAGPTLLYGLDTSTGHTLWSTLLNSDSHTVQTGDGVVCVTDTTSSGSASLVRTWDIRTGRTGWQHQWPGTTLAKALLDYGPGTMLITIGETLLALDAATGEEQWQLALDGNIVAMAVAGEMAYVSATTQTTFPASGRLYGIQL